MLKIILVVVLNLLGLLRVEGQIVQNGQCDPNIPLATDFDFSEFQGTWYEISRSAVGGADCSQYDFLSGAEIQVQNTGVNANFAEQRSGVATLQPGTAKFTLTFPSEAPQDFWILDTNNIVYAVGYRCENISPTQRSITIWTLGRQRAYPNNLVPAFINNLLVNTLGITIDELHDVDHSDDACYVLPIIQPGNPIVLPGQCDENIPVVQGFEAARFEGVWHEIAAYHSINSVNLCSRAEYRLDGTEILVENSQVVNQALDVMTGRARLATTDGSAKLLVTLDTGNNIETDLYILATDYDNYAVSYSCSNLPNNEKRVYSWILGRSRQLSAETQAAVDSVVASELVLNYQYFTQTDQSDEACFYFPEFVPNTPIVFRGQCDLNIPVVTNFDPVRYMGTWHDIESYFGVFQAHECRNANYELVDGAVRVVNTQVTDQTLLSIVGEAVLANNDGLGELIVNFPTTNSSVTVSQNYWIMDTDYDSYALVYSCVNINENEKQVFSWKLSRSKELTAQASAAINNIISQHQVLDQRYYQKVDQSPEACFYFPEPEPSTVVVFPGLCDSNIPVVQNFDLKLFEGIWHEIEAYPKEQQQGQCINHQYETGATGNTLNLRSSQVTDQFLGVTDGTLSFTSTDGSAKMNINIVVNGQIINIPFWILDTDYSDYAMAYACVQQNDDFRSVYSWVLSRTKALSTPAREKINNVIQNVEVLGQQYYVPIDQSDEACFHLPELAPGEPIILPGQCDPNVPTIANFEPGRYLGEWRLIESYPTEFQAGTCNRATYSLGANGVVNVFNTEIVNQELQTIEGTAVLTDESGKLLVKFPDTTQDADYWVLDTDYDSYALVYSCRNINSEQRRVWSWKMSRTNSLTPEATTKINEIVNKVNVLNNRYYETIDTSETGCFYFPAPEQGKAVRFRGTCENVQAVPNFDAARYTGIWHNIELYPSGSQDGSCYNAYYELLSDGVRVVNSQVVDQKLDTMIGSAVVASTDNSGKLEVTFNIGGVDQKMTLWVLATDYESYSLAYSCQEFGEERQVWSWKLSRTKQLTAAANVLINTAMAGVQVLDNRYYWPVDQTDEGCFYFPEVHPGVPVVFPGRCPTNVPFVQNFNFDQFAGIWHEIAAYPLGEDLGECSYHEYELLASVRFAYASVSNLALNFYNGSAMFAPGNTNNEGRLVITIPLSNTEFELPFYILAVDYDDYVLGYGCVDLGPVSIDVDKRIVYSWKLSRTKQLSAAAITAFNQVISSVDVLRDEYYEVVDQSDEACFFLPEVTGDVVIFPGVCDQDIPVVQDFRAADYLGRWYLIESYPSEFQNGSCNDARYTPGANGVVDVLNSQVVDQTLEEVAGTAVASTDGTGKLTVQFPDAPGPSQYWILDTDYLNYALVYSCRNIVGSNQRAVYSWKLSRTQSLSVAATNAINNVVDSINVLDNRFFNKIDHSPEGCFYFPEPKPLQQVRFRGTCDQTIGVVQNFDAARYLGLWHLIESYPSNFQLGTCNNAYYSLGATAVDVFNTQVIDQTLDTMSGLAVASADGTGKLTVSFPIAGTDQFTQTPYWILATDYDTYSLVYTCVEVDDEYRQVFSWKLGRSKQLSPTAVTAINSVTSGIQVLDERYYQPIDQSREGCFYFPEPEPGKVVRFPGQCEDIDVVQNFDLSRFEGIWHEVEAYPKEQQQGQCVNHEYLPGAGASRPLLSESVIAQTLHVTQSTFAFTSTDGSAKMSITIAGSNPPVVIPFWILSTDYTDSALAYSCVNVNEDYRHVFSWKLSRTKTLSSAGAAAINAAMQSVDVVDQRYFEPIDQSDSACFHLPALEPGQDVVFPGQCDMNIPVVQNFDAGRYLNRWRMIESYASDFQSGGCNEATYTPGTDGTVDVYNTQVIDQRLDTMTGVAEVASTDGSGKLKVQFPNAPEPSDYWILDTDYDTYSLVYSCRNLSPDTRRVWAWKLSRDRTLSQAANEKINQIMQSINVLDQRYFQTIEQSDAACFYHPEADGKPVTYRGQCDPNIAVVNNFDPSLYQGIWYDMESYPQEFQDGTCPTAQYTLNGGIVNVLNTQVRGQTLDTIEATAVLAGNPSEAKLIVTFPVAGTDLTVDMPYWVLDTDYTSYALVYSCQNINAEYRRVTSWKLSRTQTLTPESATAINAVMQQVPVLRQEYYVPRGHSEVDCFFYPDNNGGPVYLDGQCAPDNEVNVVTDFDAARFDGTWHEIARFPSQLQVGECAASQYEYTTENNFNVIMTIVNQELQTTFSGSGAVPAGNRGIINLDLNSNGLNVVGNLYCLDVDYDDFALMYSCRNVDSNRMQVYSWKLSRSKTGLSATATNRINEIVSREDNLFEGYFEETPQDTNACFHYPVFDQLPDVITLHGPCDTSIRGVANFDAGRYLGKWIEIQKYPQPFQEGKCHRAEYSLGSAAVDVYNTQVVDQKLLVQTGNAVVASTDGTGELLVTFDVNGVINQANYIILATDYDNYALVYSCRNLDNGDRQVSSWKLSRSFSLSAQANSIMASVISSTQGLLQDYYTVTDQSLEACFYVPEAVPNQEVRLRGTCDGITGQANFDLQRYLGWWHEISSYPVSKETASTCLSTQYQQVGNQVQFEDTEVFDLAAQITRGTVVATTDGKLTRTWENGQVEEIWVLATDYDNYAMVFSCEKIDDEYVRVWSSKQSKVRTLPAAAEEVFAAVVAGNQLVIDSLFLPVAQSDAACFHYPELSGQRVVLPGQCDENIPTQDGFELDKYTGTWYQLQRYPYPEVADASTCVGTRITAQNGNAASLLNWAVVDGELVTAEAQATVAEGSATLQVTVPIPDSTNATSVADLHILNTDYTTYALAYTCENINPFQRVVVAFILSRTRFMPVSSTEAIDAYMAQREEFRQDYFITVAQSDDCEEPSSSYLVKSSIALILLCYALQMLM